MTKVLHHKLLPSLILLCIFSIGIGVPAFGAIDMPLTVYDANPRYLASGGDPVLLLGIGSPLPSRKNYDYRAELDMMHAHSVNYGRVWHILPWESKNVYFPWARTGPGTANDGLPKFDLTKWDQDYWSRLKDACAYAQSKGIYLSIMLFDECGIKAWSASYAWTNHPWHPNNNINNVGLPSSYAVPQFYDLNNSKLKELQELYVGKMLSETKGYPNVFYEICNEYTGPWSWNKHWVDFLRARSSNLIAVNPHVANVPGEYWTDPKIDIVNFHWETMDPKITNQNMVKYTTNPATPKVINNDEPPENPNFTTTQYRQVAWASIVGGGHIHLECYSTEPAPNAAIANIARFLRENNIRFWKMAPNNALVTQTPGGTAHTWAIPGDEYVIQIVGSGGGSMTVNLEPGKTYEARVYRSDNTYVNLQVSGNTVSGIPSYSFDTMVHIKAVTDPIVTTPDIKLDLEVDKTEAMPGDTLTYTLRYENIGDGDAKSVTITNPISAHATYVSGSASSGGSYDSMSRAVNWSISTVSPGGKGVLTFKAKIDL